MKARRKEKRAILTETAKGHARRLNKIEKVQIICYSKGKNTKTTSYMQVLEERFNKKNKCETVDNLEFKTWKVKHN